MSKGDSGLESSEDGRAAAASSSSDGGGARGGNGDLPFAATLFEAADRLRGSVESAEYKHLVLGLLFLKYVSDSYARRCEALEAETRDESSSVYTADEAEREAILEDRDEYAAENVFWVPPEARWDDLLANANQSDIGARIDRALETIERENPDLRGVLPRIYARAPLPPAKLGELLTTLAKIGFGEDEDRARDVLGRTYEYFIKTFARHEGHRAGEYYTPASVTRLLVEMLEPFNGRVYEPAFGSAGLFIQSGRFVQKHGGNAKQLALYGQENNQATWRIGKMNLAIHGLAGDLRLGDTLLDDQFKDLRADYILANPPFNLDPWGADQVADDVRWKYGRPPDSNANFAWIQHFIHHLAPDGRAGFVMANGSLSEKKNGQGAIRAAIVADDLVDCIVSLPGQLFFSTGIPVCLWFLDQNKTSEGERDRRGKTLFIDARRMGVKIGRTQIELRQEDLATIAGIYHAWRTGDRDYSDFPGLCTVASLDAIEKHGFILSPARYVGTPENDELDEEPIEERVAHLKEQVQTHVQRGRELDSIIERGLEGLGYGG
jgi:type I restriction enzyme M protein